MRAISRFARHCSVSDDAQARRAFRHGRRANGANVIAMRLHARRKRHGAGVGADDDRLHLRSRRRDAAAALQLAPGESDARLQRGARDRRPPRTIFSAARTQAATSGEGAVAKMKLRQRLTRKSRKTRGRQTSAPETPSALPQVCSVIDVLAPLEARGEPAAARPVDARRMRLVDEKKGVVTRGDAQQIVERRDVAVHAVKAFDDDPRPAPSAPFRASALIACLERVDVIMWEAIGSARATGACPHGRWRG